MRSKGVKAKVRVGSICAGILGAELALDMMGLTPELVWYSEIDGRSKRIIERTTSNAVDLGDVKKIQWESVEPVDVICAGYPCQPFSVAGLKKGIEDERHLWPWIAESLRILRPRLALFENVTGHVRLGLDTVLSDLASIGYDAEWGTLRAADIGACHRRNRVFIVATDSRIQ
jgi:DNA (cytosine-5)-methyltransferase 1